MFKTLQYNYSNKTEFTVIIRLHFLELSLRVDKRQSGQKSWVLNEVKNKL